MEKDTQDETRRNIPKHDFCIYHLPSLRSGNPSNLSTVRLNLDDKYLFSCIINISPSRNPNNHKLRPLHRAATPPPTSNLPSRRHHAPSRSRVPHRRLLPHHTCPTFVLHIGIAILLGRGWAICKSQGGSSECAPKEGLHRRQKRGYINFVVIQMCASPTSQKSHRN